MDLIFLVIKVFGYHSVRYFYFKFNMYQTEEYVLSVQRC